MLAVRNAVRTSARVVGAVSGGLMPASTWAVQRALPATQLSGATRAPYIPIRSMAFEAKTPIPPPANETTKPSTDAGLPKPKTPVGDAASSNSGSNQENAGRDQQTNGGWQPKGRKSGMQPVVIIAGLLAAGTALMNPEVREAINTKAPQVGKLLKDYPILDAGLASKRAPKTAPPPSEPAVTKPLKKALKDEKAAQNAADKEEKKGEDKPPKDEPKPDTTTPTPESAASAAAAAAPSASSPSPAPSASETTTEKAPETVATPAQQAKRESVLQSQSASDIATAMALQDQGLHVSGTIAASDAASASLNASTSTTPAIVDQPLTVHDAVGTVASAGAEEEKAKAADASSVLSATTAPLASVPALSDKAVNEQSEALLADMVVEDDFDVHLVDIVQDVKAGSEVAIKEELARALDAMAAAEKTLFETVKELENWEKPVSSLPDTPQDAAVAVEAYKNARERLSVAVKTHRDLAAAVEKLKAAHDEFVDTSTRQLGRVYDDSLARTAAKVNIAHRNSLEKMSVSINDMLSQEFDKVDAFYDAKEREAVAAAEQRLQKLIEGEREQMSQLLADVQDKQAKRQQDLVEMRARADALDHMLTWYTEYESVANKVQKLSLAITSAQDAVNKAEPFAAAWNSVQILADHDTLIQSVVKSVPQTVPERGVVAVPTLKDRFRAVEREALKVSLQSDRKSFWGTVLANITAHALVREPGLVRGDDDYSRLARAAYHVEHEDFASAVTELEGLQPVTGEIVKDWLQSAKERVVMQEGLRTLQSHAALLAATYGNN